MQSLIHYVAPPSTCGYLPDQVWSLEYEMVLTVSPAEYMERLRHGWRRFGTMMFRPRCPKCRQCKSLRVVVDRFRPDRGQRRAIRANQGQGEGAVELKIGPPAVSRAKLDLYDRFHAFQSERKGWPEHPAKDEAGYRDSFVNNPFRTEEWCYYLEGQLIGVGYVDALPGGLSAIYFYYEPAQRLAFAGDLERAQCACRGGSAHSAVCLPGLFRAGVLLDGLQSQVRSQSNLRGWMLARFQGIISFFGDHISVWETWLS